MRWSGYGLGLRTLPGGYYAFVESFAEKIASGPSVGWIAGPWLLISIGLMTLIILYSWTMEGSVHSEWVLPDHARTKSEEKRLRADEKSASGLQAESGGLSYSPASSHASAWSFSSKSKCLICACTK